MPIYLYSCPLCDNMIELILSINQTDTSVICLECLEVTGNEIKMDRIITPPQAIIFKGKGFYSTDNPPIEKIRRNKRRTEENETS